MKRVYCLFLCMIMLFVLNGCGTGQDRNVWLYQSSLDAIADARHWLSSEYMKSIVLEDVWQELDLNLRSTPRLMRVYSVKEDALQRFYEDSGFPAEKDDANRQRMKDSLLTFVPVSDYDQLILSHEWIREERLTAGSLSALISLSNSSMSLPKPGYFDQNVLVYLEYSNAVAMIVSFAAAGPGVAVQARFCLPFDDSQIISLPIDDYFDVITYTESQLPVH